MPDTGLDFAATVTAVPCEVTQTQTSNASNSLCINPTAPEFQSAVTDFKDDDVADALNPITASNAGPFPDTGTACGATNVSNPVALSNNNTTASPGDAYPPLAPSTAGEIPGATWVGIASCPAGSTACLGGADASNPPPAYYIYDATFYLCPNQVDDSTLTGGMYADNVAGAFLNGQPIGNIPTGDYSSQASFGGLSTPPWPYGTSNGFVSGLNTVQFVVFDSSGAYTGLDFAETVTSPPCSTLPLTTAALTGAQASGVYNQDPTVTLTASDAGGPGIAGTYYQIDDGPWDAYTAPFTIAGDETHSLQFYSVDAAGNAETTQASDGFDTPNSLTVPVQTTTHDTTPPVTTASVSPTPDASGTLHGPATITLSASDAGGSGVAATYYLLDGDNLTGNWQPYSGPITISVGGQHTVQYYSVDNAGNAEAPNTLALAIYPRADATATLEVGGALSLSLDEASVDFGAAVPGVAADYTVTDAATVSSTATSTQLTVDDPGATAPGHLVNGIYSLPQGLQVDASSSDPNVSGGGVSTDLAVTNPAVVLTYLAPVTNDVVTLGFEQPIGATDPLHTGTYGKSLQFTLSVLTP